MDSDAKVLVLYESDPKNCFSVTEVIRILSRQTVSQLAARIFVRRIISNANYFNGFNETIPKDMVVSELPVDSNGMRCLKVIVKQPVIEESLWKGKVNKKTLVKTLKTITELRIPVIVPLVIIVALMLMHQSREDNEVCFGGVGCFSLGYPWNQRPVLFHFVPQHPLAIDIRLTLFSKEDSVGRNISESLGHFRDNDFEDVDWNKPLYFIIHGYLDDTLTWVVPIKDALLETQLGRCNVIAVDWSEGAKLYYPQVVANTRVVGAIIARFISIMIDESHILPHQIHLIGHSLGSHVAAYVGKLIKDISQITALDPAFPLFEGYHESTRLTSTDAKRVVVFHSNVSPLGFGMRSAVGTLDIYLNNGQDQPSCPEMKTVFNGKWTIDQISGLQDEIACSHRRAYEVFQEVIRSNSLKLYPMSQMNPLFENSSKTPSNEIEIETFPCLELGFAEASQLSRLMVMKTLDKPQFTSHC